MKASEYTARAVVILPLIIDGSLNCMSLMAAMGIDQFITGPQKWVLKEYIIILQLSIAVLYFIKKSHAKSCLLILRFYK